MSGKSFVSWPLKIFVFFATRQNIWGWVNVSRSPIWKKHFVPECSYFLTFVNPKKTSTFRGKKSRKKIIYGDEMSEQCFKKELSFSELSLGGSRDGLVGQRPSARPIQSQGIFRKTKNDPFLSLKNQASNFQRRNMHPDSKVIKILKIIQPNIISQNNFFDDDEQSICEFIGGNFYV